MLTTKTRKCRACGNLFTQYQSFVTWCSPECGAEIAAKKVAKIKREEAVKVRRADKVKKESLKRRADYIKEAQTAFNLYIRTRDAQKPCICCGKPLAVEAVGGGFDCGHYRSVGSAPHLRFEETNAHGQTKQCNRWGAGRAVDYRLGLIQRIGLSAVEKLESDQTPRKYTVDELKAIKKHYAELAKQLKGQQ
jgi:hypothetical protein